MKIALSADFHLDMRQFNSQQRWTDFINAFIKVTRKVEEKKADAYVMAGDVFHKYRPHPGIVRKFLKETSTVECPIIVIRGNHDSPRILFEKYGGDTLHLIRDVSDITYLNSKNPSLEVDDIKFVGLGYTSFNIQKEIRKALSKSKNSNKICVGIFHQLLDYPGVPETRSEISRGFLKSLGFEYVLMGHFHSAYSEEGLFNAGSPEYWAFDQAKRIEVNLDTNEEKERPPKRRGFFLIETTNGTGEFVEVEPARPMFCVTYRTENFNESIHLPKISDHLQQFNIEGAMVKSIIHGRHKYGRRSISKKIVLDKPLIHNTVILLTPSTSIEDKIDVVKTQIEYLIERGVDEETATKLSKWIENNKDRLAIMESKEILNELNKLIRARAKDLKIKEKDSSKVQLQLLK